MQKIFKECYRQNFIQNSITNIGRIKLFELFLKSGGQFKKEEVINVEQTRYNQTQVKTNFMMPHILLICRMFPDS